LGFWRGRRGLAGSRLSLRHRADFFRDHAAELLLRCGSEMRAIVVYDDPATSRPVDYIAMYSPSGELLALSWYDRFGIERMAVDGGLLENTDQPEGIFVAFSTGAVL